MDPLNKKINNGTVALTDAAAWKAIGPRINLDGRRLMIHGKNGTGALTDIQISGTAVRDGAMIPIASGADLNAAVAQIRSMRPAFPACLAAGCDWEIELDVYEADLLVEAKGAASSLTITGMVL